MSTSSAPSNSQRSSGLRPTAEFDGPSVFAADEPGYFDRTIEALRSGDYFGGLSALLTPEFGRRSVEERQRLVRAALARLKTDYADDPAARARALAAAMTVLELLDRGTLPPSTLTGTLATELDQLINHLSGLANFSDVAGSAATHGVPDDLRALIEAYDYDRTSLSEIATAILDKARLDPVYDDEQDVGLGQGRFARQDAANPDAGVAAAVNLVANIELEMDGVIRSLELAGSGASQATLASLKAQMELIKAKMDIALALLEQITTLFSKVGEAFNR